MFASEGYHCSARSVRSNNIPSFGKPIYSPIPITPPSTNHPTPTRHLHKPHHNILNLNIIHTRNHIVPQTCPLSNIQAFHYGHLYFRNAFRWVDGDPVIFPIPRGSGRQYRLQLKVSVLASPRLPLWSPVFRQCVPVGLTVIRSSFRSPRVYEDGLMMVWI